MLARVRLPSGAKQVASWPPTPFGHRAETLTKRFAVALRLSLRNFLRCQAAGARNACTSEQSL